MKRNFLFKITTSATLQMNKVVRVNRCIVTMKNLCELTLILLGCVFNMKSNSQKKPTQIK